MRAQTISIDDLRDHMKAEVGLFRRFIDLGEELNSTVKDRDWTRLDSVLDRMSDVSGEIERTENDRHRCYEQLKQDLGLESHESFGALLSCLDEAPSRDLSALHGQIKQALLSLKSMSNGLFYYFKCMHDSVNQVLGEIFPHRKGKLYSHQGRAREGSEEAMMVDKEL